jgi:hypothetical protein
VEQSPKKPDRFVKSKRELIYNALSDDSFKVLPLPNTDGDVKLDKEAALWQTTDAAFEKWK